MESGDRGRERIISNWEAKKAKIRAELLAKEERRILEEEIRKELDRERKETLVEPLSLTPSWDKLYDLERNRIGSVDRQRRSVDAACSDLDLEIFRALREVKKAKIRLELLERKERQVLEEEVRKELNLETGIRFRCCHGEPDCTDVDFENSWLLRDDDDDVDDADDDLIPRLGFEGHQLPTFSKDTLSSMAVLPELRLGHPVESCGVCPPARRSVSPPPYQEFIPLNCVEPEPSSRPSLAVADSMSKPCVEPVPSPKPSPMVIGAVYEPEPQPEKEPSSNNHSGNKRKSSAFACDICRITTTSKESLDGHLNGKRHKAATTSNERINISASKPEDQHFDKPKDNITKNRPIEFVCRVCGLKCSSRSLLNHHLTEKKHWLYSCGN